MKHDGVLVNSTIDHLQISVINFKQVHGFIIKRKKILQVKSSFTWANNKPFSFLYHLFIHIKHN